MFWYRTRHHRARSAVVIGMILALALATFGRPASAATTAHLVTGSTYPIVVIETAKASLTVAEIRRLAEQATHRTLPASPDKVWFADTHGAQPTRPMVDSLLAGQPASGVTVLRTVSQPAPQSTIGGLCADLPDGVYSFWGFLIFLVIVIIRIVTRDRD